MIRDITPLFVFDMANNHMGDIEHGKRIIQGLYDVKKDFPSFSMGIKFQYRDLDTFIHPLYQNDMSYKYIKRFSETRLSWKEFKYLKDMAVGLEFITVCTPFDECSVDVIEEHGFDIIKIASCSFTDWPLLERVVKSNKPIVASTAGSSLREIDQVVSFFVHRNVDFAIMHCVAEYPTKVGNEELNQIDLLRNRYPEVIVGYSSHEQRGNIDNIPIAIAKGAMVFEKHVGVQTTNYPLNGYSVDPDSLRLWLEKAKDSFIICGSRDRKEFPSSATKELRDLARGIWAKRDIEVGERLLANDVLFAIPTQSNQLIANDMSKYKNITIITRIKKDAPITLDQVSIIDNRENVYEIIHKVQTMIKESGINIPSRLDLEISHHYGLENFDKYGCVLITFINKSYCKKLIFVLPGQKHPTQYHELKEETFNVLYGDLQVQLDDGAPMECIPGDTVDVLPGARHTFSSKTGAIIEEISTTHDKADSYYVDPQISKNKDRKTYITDWRDK